MTKSDDIRVSVDASGLRLGGEQGELLPLLAGAMHYFQLPSALWGRCLDGMRELGLEIVDTYVPWGIHERGEAGVYDFESADGRYNRRLDAFLDACAERDLKVLLRPGPHINAELTYFGFPERIVKDGRCLARGAAGQPVIMPAPPRFFPAPSYASERFFEEATHWLRAVAERVAPRRWPDGPVIAAQVDNELAMFFRTAAYDQDYHPDAITAYRRWLGERYGDGLPSGYGGIDDPETAEPPRVFDAGSAEQLVPHLDWIAFKEHLVRRALARLGAALREGGLEGIPLTHNFPAAGHGESVGLACAERVVDIASVDLYLLKRDYAASRHAAERVAGSSRLPMLGELGWGGALWWAPQSLEDQLASALTALMYGVRAVSFYMTVGRDRWYGAPIDERGRHDSARFEATRSLVAAIREAELWSLERDVAVGLIEVRALRRLQRATLLTGPTPPMVLDLFGLGPQELCSDETFGFASAVQRDVARVEVTVVEVLDELGVAFHRVDSAADVARLSRYRVLIVPSFEIIDVDLLERLVSYVDGGGQLVLLPRVPERDLTMQPLSLSLPSHVLIGGDDPSEALEALLDRLALLPELTAQPEGIDVAHYRRESESVIFVANRGDASRQVSLQGLDFAGRWVWDALTGAPINPRALHVEARQVRMLRSRPSHTGPVPRQPRPSVSSSAEEGPS